MEINQQTDQHPTTSKLNQNNEVNNNFELFYYFFFLSLMFVCLFFSLEDYKIVI